MCTGTSCVPDAMQRSLAMSSHESQPLSHPLRKPY